MKRSLGIVVVLLALWTALQLLWLGVDERIPDGDVLGNVGAVELFWEERPGRTAPGELLRSYREDFGPYPALYPALTGIFARWLGVSDLGGDGPVRVALLWSWLAVLATWALGRQLGGDRVGVLAAALLLLSPLWSALQRHVMLENGVCALVALTAAAGFVAAEEESVRRSRLTWLVAGLAAGAALLVKQTAILALIPLGVGLVVASRGARWRPALAGLVALAIAGPWYLRRLGSGDDYLLRSAQANPDAVGPLHQLLYYPAVLLQQPWAPAVVLAAAVLGGLAWRSGLRESTSRARIPLGVVAGGVLLLVLLPKKYPRLLLPLLPLLVVVLAAWLDRWPARLRAALLGLAAASLLATSLPLGAASELLGEGQVGLLEVDERCSQDWIVPPAGAALDWEELLALLEEAGGAGQEYRVGALRWPVPPCSHQTSLHLGEHLRIRVRRGGLEAYVLSGEGWETEPGWPEGKPDVLVSVGRLDCGEEPLGCAGGLQLQETGSVELPPEAWRAQRASAAAQVLVVHRVLPEPPAGAAGTQEP